MSENYTLVTANVITSNFLKNIIISDLNPRYTRFTDFKEKLLSEISSSDWTKNIWDLLNSEEEEKTFINLMESLIKEKGLDTNLADFFTISIGNELILLDGNRRITALNLLLNATSWIPKFEDKIKNTDQSNKKKLYKNILEKLKDVSYEKIEFDINKEISYRKFEYENELTNDLINKIYIRFNSLHNNSDEMTKANWSRYKTLIDSFDLKTKKVTSNLPFIYSNLIIDISNPNMSIKNKVNLPFSRIENSITPLLNILCVNKSSTETLKDFFKSVLDEITKNVDDYNFIDISSKIIDVIKNKKEYDEIKYLASIIYSFTFEEEFEIKPSLWSSHGIKEGKLFQMFCELVSNQKDKKEVHTLLSDKKGNLIEEEKKLKKEIKNIEIKIKNNEELTLQEEDTISVWNEKNPSNKVTLPNNKRLEFNLNNNEVNKLKSTSEIFIKHLTSIGFKKNNIIYILSKRIQRTVWELENLHKRNTSNTESLTQLRNQSAFINLFRNLLENSSILPVIILYYLKNNPCIQKKNFKIENEELKIKNQIMPFTMFKNNNEIYDKLVSELEKNINEEEIINCIERINRQMLNNEIFNFNRYCNKYDKNETKKYEYYNSISKIFLTVLKIKSILLFDAIKDNDNNYNIIHVSLHKMYLKSFEKMAMTNEAKIKFQKHEKFISDSLNNSLILINDLFELLNEACDNFPIFFEFLSKEELKISSWWEK